MPGIHALVAEDAPHLIDPLHAADDQPLEGQLRGDAHIHINVQRIVVGDKGPRGGAAGDGIQHRRLHLHIAPVVQEIPQVLDKGTADLKISADLWIDDQVHVPLAVAGLLVGEAVELLRQGQKGLREQGDGLPPHAHLPPLGAEDHAVDADDVADVILFKAVILRLVHLVLPGVELDAAGLVLEVAEADLAHAPLAHETAGDGDLGALQRVELVLDLLGVVAHHELGLLEGVPALSLEGGQLLPADPQDLAEVLLDLGGAVIFSHDRSLLFCNVAV